MARFMVLIHGNESRWEAMTAQEMQQIDEAHRTFRERVGAAVLSSGQLASSRCALVLRRNAAGGGPAITEGPFGETTEVLGGYYVVEATDRGQVTAWVEGLAELTHDHSWVEVWPLVDAPAS